MSNLIATEKGLSLISKELINYKGLNESLFTSYGTAIITSRGILENISDSNYVSFPISLQYNNKFSVSIGGDYKVSKSEQCILSLYNPISMYNQFGIFISSNSIRVRVGEKTTILLDSVSFNSNEYLNFKVSINPLEDGSATYEIIVLKGLKKTEYHGNLKYLVDLSEYTTACIGKSYSSDGYSWKGTVHLKDILITEGNSVLFNPTVSKPLTFTKLLISDGTISLKDSSSPVINHIEEFPIIEISRTNSNVLLKASVDNSSSLSIVEIGLYASDGTDEILFSLAGGLSIHKDNSLGYDLIFNVSLYMSIVNTVFFPKIAIKSDDAFNHVDLNKIVFASDENGTEEAYYYGPDGIEKFYYNEIENMKSRTASLVDPLSNSVHKNNDNDYMRKVMSCSDNQKFFNCIYIDNNSLIKGFYPLYKYGYNSYKSYNLCNSLEYIDIIDKSACISVGDNPILCSLMDNSSIILKGEDISVSIEYTNGSVLVKCTGMDDMSFSVFNPCVMLKNNRLLLLSMGSVIASIEVLIEGDMTLYEIGNLIEFTEFNEELIRKVSIIL